MGLLTSFTGLDSEVSHIAVIYPTEWREMRSGLGEGKLENNMKSTRVDSSRIPELPAINRELYSAPQLRILTGTMLRQQVP